MIIKGMLGRYERWNPVHPTAGAFWGVGLGFGCGVGWGPGFGPEVIGYVGAGCGVGFSVGITLAGVGVGLPQHGIIKNHYHGGARRVGPSYKIEWPEFNNRLTALQRAQTDWPNPLFFEVFLTAAWSLWKERNNKHFRGIAPAVGSWYERFKEDLGLVQHRVNEARRAALLSYCATLA